MNGTYYKTPVFNFDEQKPRQVENYMPNEIQNEQSYIENILRKNKGKKATAYVSYSDSVEWRDKVFTGTIEDAGRDHLIMNDPSTGKWYLIPLIYIDYVEFDEKLNFGL